MSLIDYPGKVAAIVFTQGCAFACRYCHNPELIKFTSKRNIDPEDIFRYLKQKRYFLDGVVITGGEPTLQKDLIDFIECVQELGLKVKLDTSGISPEVIQEVIEKRIVSYIAMDIKHVWEKYEHVTQVTNQRYIQKVQKTFSLIQQSEIDHEFRTTVFPAVHSEADFFEIASYFLPGESYFLQQIRYLKVLDQKIQKKKRFDVKEIVHLLKEKYPLLKIDARE